MVYSDYVLSLTPNHYWKLYIDSADSGTGQAVTTPNPTNANVTYDGAALTKDATTSAKFNNGYLDFGDANDVNVTGPWFRRSYSMWAQADKADQNYMLYSEGGSVRNITTMFGIGGTVQYICDNDSDSDAGCPWSQAVVSKNIKLNTPYHIGLVWESDRADTGPAGKNRSYMRCYLNGRFIGEKEIYKWDTNLNQEILTEPGGQLNAHSGNIVMGQGRNIIVSKKVFSPVSHQGLMSDVAIWDNVLLTDADMWQLFSQAAKPTTATVTFTNIPVNSELRLWNIDGSDQGTTEVSPGVELSTLSDLSLSYTVADEVRLRLTLLSPGKQVYSKVLTFPREDSSIDVSLLLREDRNYLNPL